VQGLANNKETPIRILHVDDDLSLLTVSKQILQDLDNQLIIELASSAAEALEKIATNQYDVVVSDYEMPQKNGLDLLKEIRQKNEALPFILFTGKGREEVAISALNLGADGYINKQGSPETVYGELTHAIQQAVLHKRAESKLLETEHLTQKIVESTPNLIYIYDLIEQRNVYANKEVTDFLGYTAEEVKAMGSALFANILHPEDAKIVAEHHARFKNAEDNAIYEVEYRMKHSKGQWHWLHSRDILFARTKDGVGKQILGSCEDITERKSAELEIKQKNILLESLSENIAAGLAIIDRNYRVIWANKMLRNAGGNPGELCYKIFAHSEEVCSDCGVKQVFEQNLPAHIHEYKTKDAKGQTLWIELRVTPLKDESGKITAALELAVPITERKQAEEKLKAIYQAIPVPTYTWQAVNDDFILLNYNEAANEITKGAVSKFVGIKASKMYASTPDIFNDINHCFKTKTAIQKETDYIFQSTNETKRLNVKYAFVPPDLVLVHTEDITEHKRIEQLISQSEKRYRGLFSSMTEGVCLHELVYNEFGKAVDYKIIDVNPAYETLLDIKREDAIEKLASKLYGANEPPYLETYITVAETGKPSSFQTYFPPLKKYFSISVFSPEKGKFATIFSDTTKQKEAEQQLLLSSNLFNLATDAILVIDLEGNIIDVNDAASSLTGYSKKELTSMKIQMLDTPESASMVASRIQQIIEKGSAVFESVQLRRDRSVAYVEIHARTFNSEGKTLMLSVIRDITERKNAEHEQEQLLYQIGERLKELNCLYGLADLVEKPGVTLESILQGTPALLTAAYQYPEVTAARVVLGKHDFSSPNIAVTPWKQTAEIKLANEQIGFVEVYHLKEMPEADEGPFLKEERQLINAVAERLSRIYERYKAEAFLQASEQRWSTTLNSIGDAVIATNLSGFITFMNIEAEKLTGWKLSEATQKPLTDVFKIVNEYSRLEVTDPVTKVLETGQVIGLANHTILIRKDQSEVAIDDSGAPIRNLKGEITGVVLVFRDITQRRQAEQLVHDNFEKIQAANEKLRVVGGLTRHDVRNKLSIINGNVHLLKKKLGADSQLSPYLKNIESSTAMAERLFEFGKLYERIGAEQPEKTDAGQCFNEAAALMPELHSIEVANECRGLIVVADSLLQQVFYNFIDNSLKHGKKVTKIRLSSIQEKNAIKLVYEDNGAGISPENKAKLFTEGFSTGNGTGLGLAIIKKILQVYGWTIVEDGVFGKGSRFVITIPKQ
jgi:PAS domain S-box-containing protein